MPRPAHAWSRRTDVHADCAELASVSLRSRRYSHDTTQMSAADSLALTVSSASQLHIANQKDVVTFAEPTLYRNVYLTIKLYTREHARVPSAWGLQCTYTLASNKCKAFHSAQLLHNHNCNSLQYYNTTIIQYYNTTILQYYNTIQYNNTIIQYYNTCNKKLIRRWDSERELSLRRHRARTTKYNILVHKFRHRSTQLCVGTHVYQILWNNAI